MPELVKDLEQEEKFSPYPEQVDKYFQDNEIIIRTFPQEMSMVAEFEFPDFRVTSAKQYMDYLDEEIEFWQSKDPNQKLKSIVQYGNSTIAKQEFENAIKNIGSPSYFQNSLKNSVSRVRTGILYSKTKLAQILLEYIDRSKNFFDGFKAGILDNKSTSVSTNTDNLEGFLAALEYRETYRKYISYSEDTIKEFQENAEAASKRYSELNQTYVAAFHEQQNRIALITQQTNEHLTELDQKSAKQFADADARLVNMEKAYREKLRLEAPAEYWAKLKTSYSIKGYVWFGVSGLFAAAIIALLLIVLIKDVIVFSAEANWIENLKNSAIITIIASIGIYALRLATKMALSSHHLADDARERENLSLFYLSLIEKGAVTDKERALVLNALFSRSDTGLLKGDAAPSMPSNVADIIDIIKKAQG